MAYQNPPGRRLYVGRIAPNAQRLDLEDYFSSMGPKPLEVKIFNGFGFVEYDSVADAEDAIKEFDGRDFMGDRLLVQFAKGESRRPRYDDRDDRRGGYGYGDRDRYERPREKPSPGWRLNISNLPPGTSWQDLKDFARTAGNVHYAEVSRTNSAEGIIEYLSFSDADNALKSLDGVDMRGSVVRVDEGAPPPGQSWSNPRASPPRRGSPPRRDSYRDSDRDRGYSRRDRSRSRSPGYSRRDRDDRDERDDRDRGSSRRYDDRRDRDRDDRGSSRRDRSRSRDRSPVPPPRARSPVYD